MGLVGYNSVTVSVGAVSTFLLPACERRVSLTISGVSSGIVSLGFGQPAVVNQGISVGLNMQPLVLTEATHGDMIKHDIFGIASAPPRPLALTEGVRIDDCGCKYGK